MPVLTTRQRPQYLNITGNGYSNLYFNTDIPSTTIFYCPGISQKRTVLKKIIVPILIAFNVKGKLYFRLSMIIKDITFRS